MKVNFEYINNSKRKLEVGDILIVKKVLQTPLLISRSPEDRVYVVTSLIDNYNEVLTVSFDDNNPMETIISRLRHKGYKIVGIADEAVLSIKSIVKLEEE